MVPLTAPAHHIAAPAQPHVTDARVCGLVFQIGCTRSSWLMQQFLIEIVIAGLLELRKMRDVNA